jgi:putative glutamine amidotransferase
MSIAASLVSQSHVDRLVSAGCTPVLLPSAPGVEQLVGLLDGLLVPGGGDVDPALYGATAHPKTRGISQELDAAELAMIEEALSFGVPVFCICRGMQLLNVHRGGTLHQHLPEITGHDGHAPETESFTLGEQRVDLKPGSHIAGIFGADTGEATCHHHQGVDQVGTGFVATHLPATGFAGQPILDRA